MDENKNIKRNVIDNRNENIMPKYYEKRGYLTHQKSSLIFQIFI